MGDWFKVFSDPEPNGVLVGIDTGFDENGAVVSGVYLINSATSPESFVQALPGFNIIALVYQEDMLLGLDSTNENGAEP